MLSLQLSIGNAKNIIRKALEAPSLALMSMSQPKSCALHHACMPKRAYGSGGEGEGKGVLVFFCFLFFCSTGEVGAGVFPRQRSLALSDMGHV